MIKTFGKGADVGFVAAPRTSGNERSLQGFDGKGVGIEGLRLFGKRQLATVARKKGDGGVES